MEFHGTWSAPISITKAVLKNFMELAVCQFRWHEQFYGIPWNLGCTNFAHTSSSSEFKGIPWNLDWANFDDMTSSMEFHGIWSVPISLEFHGTWNAPISLTRAFPWNSMEHGVRQFRWNKQFHGIPWKLKCANFIYTHTNTHIFLYVFMYIYDYILLPPPFNHPTIAYGKGYNCLFVFYPATSWYKLLVLIHTSACVVIFISFASLWKRGDNSV